MIKFASIILFTAIAAAPFPFGSTDPSVIAVWCVVLGFALILASARSLQRWQGLPLIVCGILVALYAAVIWLQVSSPAAALGGCSRPGVARGRRYLGRWPERLHNRDPAIEPFFAFGAPLLAIPRLCGELPRLPLDEARARQLLISHFLGPAHFMPFSASRFS